MSSDFWVWVLFFGNDIFCLALLVWVRNMAYRHGIWDGAFNHFLPVVRREMMFYDKRRAEIIFEEEDVKFNGG